jgi:hypothetical protein
MNYMILFYVYCSTDGINKLGLKCFEKALDKHLHLEYPLISRAIEYDHSTRNCLTFLGEMIAKEQYFLLPIIFIT